MSFKNILPTFVLTLRRLIWRIEPYDFTLTSLFLVYLGVSNFWDKFNVVIETTFSECV